MTETTKKPAKKPSEKARETAPPADHQKPTAKTEVEGAQEFTVTLREREWKVDANRLADDYEFFELITAVVQGGQAGAMAMPRALYGLLGQEQRAELMDLLRDEETGKVNPADVYEFTIELITQASPNS